MSEQIQEARGAALALVAAGMALATVIVNLVHSGKVLWGGLVVLVLSLVVWQQRRRNTDRN